MTYSLTTTGSLKTFPHVTEDEAERIWTNSKSLEVETYVKALWYTGLRQNEVLALKVADLKLDGRDFTLLAGRLKKRGKKVSAHNTSEVDINLKHTTNSKFVCYRSPSVRGWMFRTSKGIAEKAVFSYASAESERRAIPSSIRDEVLGRAKGRCENEQCSYTGKPDIHHIDMNNNHNAFTNLVALCPNCHRNAHHGTFTATQLFNWVRRDYQRVNRSRNSQTQWE